MKKPTGTDEAADPVATTEAPDAGTVAPETSADAAMEVPAAGGSYVRQKDGTLKRED